MSKYYHITSSENLDSIYEKGLLPQSGFLSDLMLEPYPAIFMFKELDEVSNAMDTWFGYHIDYVYKREELVLLEVDIPDNIEVEERYGWEGVCCCKIPPECISVIEFPKK